MGKRPRENAYAEAYKGLIYTPIESTDQPGTAHSFFKESYRMKIGGVEQILHRHVNGLVVVTVGDDVSPEAKELTIVGEISAVASQSAGAKRKYQAKMLRGKDRGTHPKDVLLRIDDQEYYTGVFGTIIEINKNLSIDLIKSDPLLNGYAAVVLPSGPFPPK